MLLTGIDAHWEYNYIVYRHTRHVFDSEETAKRVYLAMHDQVYSGRDIDIQAAIKEGMR